MKYLLTTCCLGITIFISGQDIKLALEKNIQFFKLSNYIRHQEPFDANGYPSHIYRVRYAGFMTLIENPGMRLVLTEVPSDLRYPDTTFTLIGYMREHWEYEDSIHQLRRIQGCDDCYIPLSSHRYLLGYKKEHPEEILFISGQMMKDDIWWDFRPGGYTAANLIAYIRLKCFNYDVDSIRFDRKQGSLYYFSGTVKIKKGEHTFVFDQKHPAVVRVYPTDCEKCEEDDEWFTN